MLLQRIITGIILIFASLAIIYLNEIQFIVFSGIFAVIAVWEWSYIAGYEKTEERALYFFRIICTLPIFAILVIGLWIQSSVFSGRAVFGTAILISYLLVAQLVLGFVLAIINSSYRRYCQSNKNYLPRNNINKAKSIIGYFILTPACLFLFWLKKSNPDYLLLLLWVIWIADVGALFAKYAFEKYNLANKIIPIKHAGMLGSLLFGGILTFAFVIWKDKTTMLGASNFTNYSFLLTAVIIIVSILTNNLKSWFKNKTNKEPHSYYRNFLISIVITFPAILVGIIPVVLLLYGLFFIGALFLREVGLVSFSF